MHSFLCGSHFVISTGHCKTVKFEVPGEQLYGPVFPWYPFSRCGPPIQLNNNNNNDIKGLESLTCGSKHSGLVCKHEAVRGTQCYSTQTGILVPGGCAPFGQHQESLPLGWFNTRGLQFMDFPSNLTNLIG